MTKIDVISLIAQRIKEIRKSQNLPQTALARRMGVSQHICI
jgi:transcriptional regulator with XRE-family HTH domain